MYQVSQSLIISNCGCQASSESIQPLPSPRHVGDCDFSSLSAAALIFFRLGLDVSLHLFFFSTE